MNTLIGTKNGADYYNISDLLRIQTYAAKRGLTRRAVEYQVSLGYIQPIIIDGVNHISWKIYKDHVFRSANKNKSERKNEKTLTRQK